MPSLYTEDKISIIADKLCELSKKYSNITLQGNLGYGKTTLVKKIISNLAQIDEKNITSPTFSIYNKYFDKVNNREIVHFDLYRLKSPDELFNVDFYDFIQSGSLVLIEWPEIALKYINQNYVLVKITKERTKNKKAEDTKKEEGEERFIEVNILE